MFIIIIIASEYIYIYSDAIIIMNVLLLLVILKVNVSNLGYRK